MEDVSSGENLCIKVSGCPTAWKKPGHFLFPQLSEVLRRYLVTASLLFPSPHAKAPPPTAGKAKDTAESTKLSLGQASTHGQPGRAPLHPALDPQGTAMATTLPSPLLPLQDGSGTCFQPLLLRGWWLIVTGGVGLSRCFCAVGAWSSPSPGCSMASERCGDWVNHRENRSTPWKKSTFCPPTPTPPSSSPKATSKTDHRDGTEEHALKRGRGDDVSSRGEADPASLPLSGLTPLPAGLGSVPAPFHPMQGPCPH